MNYGVYLDRTENKNNSNFPNIYLISTEKSYALIDMGIYTKWVRPNATWYIAVDFFLHKQNDRDVWGACQVKQNTFRGWIYKKTHCSAKGISAHIMATNVQSDNNITGNNQQKFMYFHIFFFFAFHAYYNAHFICLIRRTNAFFLLSFILESANPIYISSTYFFPSLLVFFPSF